MSKHVWVALSFGARLNVALGFAETRRELVYKCAQMFGQSPEELGQRLVKAVVIVSKEEKRR